jgi:addiction module HigA family antidote
MADTSTLAHIRDVSAPGEVLEEALTERGMSNADLGRRAELSEKHVSQLINARVPLSLDVAFKLEQVLGIPSTFWMSLESNYRAEQKRAEQRERLKDFKDWMRSFPLGEMVRCGYLADPGRDVVSRVEALLHFFGVTSPQAWQTAWSHALGRFRKSPKFDPNRYALTAWLRRGEIEAQAIECARYDPAKFRATLPEARKLTVESPDVFEPRLREMCAKAGVAFTLVPSLPGLAISGVTRWVGADKAIISLSLRHKSDDQLWFSYFHETCHVLEHKTSAIYIDAIGETDGDADEKRANQFARDLLIPQDEFARYVSGGMPTLTSIKSFASRAGVSAGIVVGRLQHEGVLKHTHGNRLKMWFKWDFEC